MHYKLHRNKVRLMKDHKHTNYIPYQLVNNYCMGTNLCFNLFTCNKGNTWGSVLALSIWDWLWKRNSLILRKICDIIWIRDSLLWWRLQNFWSYQKWIFQMSLAFNKYWWNAFVVNSFSEDGSHRLFLDIIYKCCCIIKIKVR